MSLSMNYFGDRERAKDFEGIAKMLLYKLENRKKLGKLKQIWDQHTFTDGTVIRMQSIYDKQTVWITSPFGKVEEEKAMRQRIEVKRNTAFVGYNYGLTYADWRVCRTEQTGVLEWDKTIHENNHYYSAKKVAVDPEGNVFTVGDSFVYDPGLGSYTFYNWSIEKRDKDGIQRWFVEENTGQAIDVIEEGDYIYVVGRGYGGVSGAYTQVEKRSKDDGSLIWQQVYSKLGDYDRAMACAVASDYLFVTDYSLSGTITQTTESRVLSVDKDTGTVMDTDVMLTYTSPFARDMMFEINVAVKNKNGSGKDNVFLMSDIWVKDLAGTTYATLTYDYVLMDYLTIDKAIAADSTGIYTVGQLPQATGTFQGYEVKKWDYTGTELWAVIYNDDIGAFEGPFLSDISVDNKLVYVSGHKIVGSTVYGIRQAITKDGGNLAWTELDPTCYLWGVNSCVKIEQELIDEE